MRALITGVTGFVGKYLEEHLLAQGYVVFGTTSQVVDKGNNIEKFNLDTNVSELTKVLDEIKPDEIYHLAGFTNVRESWDNKIEETNVNVNLTITLLEAVRLSTVAKSVKVLTVGSSEEYGRVNNANVPINENVMLQPMNPYGMSKAAVSHLAKQYYVAYGLKVIHVRPFNHIGPEQRQGFVVPDFTSQIINIEKKHQQNIIKVGNLDAQRDFTDVRDIVRAYCQLLKTESFGDVVNVCSGKPIRIGFILEELIRLSSQDINIVIDPNKLRPIDIPLYVGDNAKLVQLTGWEPQYSLEVTLKETIDYYRKL